MIEIAIKVTDDDSALTSKYLVHEEGLTLSHDDALLKAFVKETCDKFKGDVTDVLIKIKYTW